MCECVLRAELSYHTEHICSPRVRRFDLQQPSLFAVTITLPLAAFFSAAPIAAFRREVLSAECGFLMMPISGLRRVALAGWPFDGAPNSKRST